MARNLQDSLPESKKYELKEVPSFTSKVLFTEKNTTLTEVKPIVFHLRGGRHFTQGDRKPLWILVVLAAKGSVGPVYIHGDDLYKAPPDIEKLAAWYIGENWQDKLHIYDTYSSEMVDLKKTPQGYIEIEARHPAEEAWKTKNNIIVDFGDNARPLSRTHRFVTCLMSNYRPNDRHFGSLYLPLSHEWSDTDDLNRLKDFHTQYSKIICFAGSQTPPVTLDEVVEWLETKPGWGVVLVGWQWKYDTQTMESRQIPTFKEIIQFDHIVYEDLVQYVDFFVSNCGAGSVAAAFAGGCPQQCGSTGTMMGTDKTSNNLAINAYKVGPLWKKKTTPLIESMKEVTANLPLYKIEAQKAKRQIEKESEHLWKVMPKFFELLSSDPDFQELVLREGIPDEYSLGKCPLIRYR